jgi:hypothetical protein
MLIQNPKCSQQVIESLSGKYDINEKRSYQCHASTSNCVGPEMSLFLIQQESPVVAFASRASSWAIATQLALKNLSRCIHR